MPVSLRDKDVENFCSKHSIDFQDLMEAADNLDANLALVDDVVKLWIKSQNGESTNIIEDEGQDVDPTVLKQFIKHLQISEIEEFNSLKAQFPEAKLNFAGLDLHGAMLSRINLSNSNLTGVNLIGA